MPWRRVPTAKEGLCAAPVAPAACAARGAGARCVSDHLEPLGDALGEEVCGSGRGGELRRDLARSWAGGAIQRCSLRAMRDWAASASVGGGFLSMQV